MGVKKQVGDLEFNVTDLEMENGVSAGIYLRSFSEITIPIYEEHRARTHANISFGDWSKMSGMEKAIVVALMRIEDSIKGHQADAEIQEAKSRARKTET